MNSESPLKIDIQALSAIGHILVDQVRLYDRAAEIADAENAGRAIARAKAERETLLGDVNDHIRRLGENPDVHGTALGAGHKAFLNARAVVDDDDKTALGEVERGEDYLRDEVRKHAGDEKLSASTRTFFGDILARIKPVHEEISALKRRLAGD